jgi:hypothetical protein
MPKLHMLVPAYKKSQPLRVTDPGISPTGTGSFSRLSLRTTPHLPDSLQSEGVPTTVEAFKLF